MSSAILDVRPLGFPWQTIDPFLFCVHHDDAYPRGDERMAPAASLSGRNIGQDFAGKDGWNMYHGDVVPGFPQHPHRGFETVTVVRRGFIDHSDSLGATARFGGGDAQWLTAGGGIVHSEMFPLRERERDNPLELFQIWLNLPAADKMVEPHFTMLWNEDIPTVVSRDEAGKTTDIVLVAGELDGKKPPPPPLRSYASRAEADVAIWSFKLQPGASYRLAPARGGEETLRTLSVFRGSEVTIDGRTLRGKHAAILRGDAEVEIRAGRDEVEILMLQGRPIGEPIAAHGPFVMNTASEIQQAMADYRRTQFGGWPWPSDGPVHAREKGRFAKHADGRVDDRKLKETTPAATKGHRGRLILKST